MPGLDAGDPRASGNVRAVARALDVVRLLAEARRPLSVSDIAERTDLPHATTHRLLTTLVAEGWVEQSRYSARYRFGTGILGAAAIALAHAPLIERGRHALTRLVAATGISGGLAVLVERRIAYLAYESPDEQRNRVFRPGVTQPAHCTAAGKMLLSALEPAEFRALFPSEKAMRRYTARTITDPRLLEQALAAIREQRFAADEGEFQDSLRDFAAPILDQSGRTIAALSCGGLADLMTAERRHIIHQELRERAVEISLQLGLHEE